MTAHVRVDGVWVDAVFPCGNVEFSSTWRTDDYCGDLQASVTLSCPKTFEAGFTLPGRRFEVPSPTGARLFYGITKEPDRSDDGVTIHAVGVGGVLADYPAIYDAGSGDLQATSVPNDAVDYCVANIAGCPFRRGTTDLGSVSIAQFGEEFTNLRDLLVRAAIIQGKRLQVDVEGYISFVADPTTPTFVMNPGMGYMGTADEQFVSALYGAYLGDNATRIKLTVTGSPTGGNFTLTGNGATTGTIARNASAATVQTAVRTLGGPFTLATVTSPATWTYLIYVGSTAAVTLDLGTNSLTGGTNSGITTESFVVPNIASSVDTEAATQFGFKSARIDLTPLGRISSTDASAYVAGRFALIGGRMGYTDVVDVDDTNMRHISGGWASARWVRAGQMLRIPGVTDSRSNPTTRASQDVILSEVRVVEDTYPAATAAPLGFTPRDFEGALAPAENPTTKEAA